MADKAPQFETQNVFGTVLHFSGSVTNASWVAIPTVAGQAIDTVSISILPDQNPNRCLLISFDGGTNYEKLYPAGVLEEDLVDNITQIHIKSLDVNAVYYQGCLELENKDQT